MENTHNVYDFDGTIYRGDSTVDFHRFCMGRYPRVVLDAFPAVFHFALMGLGLEEKTKAKERFYRFLSFIPDMDRALTAFWKTHMNRIKPWYLAEKSPEDIIVSASPCFLLEPACKSLGVTVIASRVDPNTGKTEGLNCHGEEKVRRLYAAVPECKIEKFYSDTLSDSPLAALAKEAYLVRGERRKPFFQAENPGR